MMLDSALRALETASLGGVDHSLFHCLQETRRQLASGSVAAAIRIIDRGWRTMPDAVKVLAPIYGRLMSLDDRDHDAALRLLQLVEVRDADIAALITRAYLHLLRPNDAKQNLDLALRQFSVAPGSLLAQVASKALESRDIQAPGWVALASTLEFTGELAHPEAAESLQIRFGDATLEHPAKIVMRKGRTTFSFRAPVAGGDSILQVSAQDASLLGSGGRYPPDYSLDGRADCDGDWVSGWARVGWAPHQLVQLLFADETGRHHRFKTHHIALSGHRWPFRMNLRRLGLRGSRISISAQLPHGRWEPLPDTPLLRSRAVRTEVPRPARLSRWRPVCPHPPMPMGMSASQPASLVDVVIPVYRGRQETLACIDSVLTTIGKCGSVIVIDDATEDAGLALALRDLATAGHITLLRNETNLGFVGAVNRVLAMDSIRDVVLLNSDTLVFHDWLKRMRTAAYCETRVGTVTPWSNDGSIVSYPRESGSSLHPEDALTLDELAAGTHPGISIEVPVGVGFCLYLRRDCLNDVGEFDASVFGTGYGEEVDFCLRARMKGWSHRLAADVFVYHAGGRSFGARRAALLERSGRLLNLRHPGYDRFIASFLTQDPLRPLRRRLDERRLCSFEGRFVLLVTLALEGGVERFVAERCRQIRERGSYPLVLKAHVAGDSSSCELWNDVIDAPNLRYDIPRQVSELTALLSQLRIDQTEIHHFLDLDAKVIDAVRTLGVPYEVFIHDYAWICPRVTLIDGSGRYCGEPAITVCESCVRKNGSRLGETLSVSALRARSATWLRNASHVSTPSQDTAARLKGYFPGLEIEVRPHSSLIKKTVQSLTLSRLKSVRVGLIGAIGVHKGYRVLLDCARDAARRRLPIEFVVIGYTEDDKRLLKTGKVFITGRYTEIEVPHLLRRERPDIIFLPSVWPETYCYAVDHAVEAQLPVVSFDLGAIAERLRAAEIGILLPLSLGPEEINNRLLGRDLSARNRRPYVETARSGRLDNARVKKNRGTTMNSSVSESSRDEGLSASVQVLPLPTGLYLFSVKAAAAPLDSTSGKLRLPAMHVGLGPGTRSESVEFVSGPGTDGTWLFAHGDVLVAKVGGTGATLILTSVRASNGDVLSIAVERLETRSQPMPPIASESEKVPTQMVADAGSNADIDAGSDQATVMPTDEPFVVPMQIKTHIRSRGDMTFSDAPWAGRVAPGLWIESFSIQPLKHLTAQDIEYKGLTGTGFETPWISEDQNCGTKGISVPLVGFAMRLKPHAATAAYACEYSGYYRSGVTVGPLRNGAPCRSMVANDPLEGIQIRIIKRAKEAAGASIDASTAAARVEALRASVIAPSFGRYRDGETAPGTAAPAASQSMPKAVAPRAIKGIRPAAVNDTSDRKPRSTPRPQHRKP
jgi:GT2 family glycosyltransferase